MIREKETQNDSMSVECKSTEEGNWSNNKDKADNTDTSYSFLKAIIFQELTLLWH